VNAAPELIALLDDRPDDAPGRLQRWGAVLALACGVLGIVLLLAGSASLAGADLGTSVRARTCSASPLLGLGLLLLAGVALAAAPTLGRLRHPGAVATWDVWAVLAAAPVPAALALLSIPGVLGCRVAADLADWPLLGDALTGIGGLVVAPVALVLLGASCTLALHVSWALLPLADLAATPSVVERAIQDAEDLAVEQQATRFHGVDSPEP
jgi:hypothetical protein